MQYHKSRYVSVRGKAPCYALASSVGNGAVRAGGAVLAVLGLFARDGSFGVRAAAGNGEYLFGFGVGAGASAATSILTSF